MDDLADGRVGHSVLRNNLVTTRGQAYTSTKPGGTGMIRFATMNVLLLTGTAVLAQDRDLAVTTYSGDLALVQDTRSMAIGRVHGRTPVTNAHIGSRHHLGTKK